MTTNSDNGVVSIRSHKSVAQTVQRLEQTLAAKGIQLFAVIDHSGEAEKVGLQMRPTKLLIFGNPKGGTPLMIAAPTVALDLPLKILIWEEADDTVWVSYNDSTYLQRRHGVPADLAANISVVGALAALAAE
jgi:uncharacterized protein (DUF302 family)